MFEAEGHNLDYFINRQGYLIHPSELDQGAAGEDTRV